ncbi:hypothetical protein WJU23_08770 [Prosthecobacter sp. SYSU 5D2]|uniref:hypothetical protein n=1 Tax=Prosthecobacter sp. SYSU 5D2 TaxID=3134134 RepID=UPI0031FEAA63
MTDPSHTLWLQTFAVLAALGAGLMLHLKWHPLRDCFSDAWDMLQSFGWLVPMMAALQLRSGSLAPWAIPMEGMVGALTAWRGMLAMLPAAAMEVAALTHGFFPPWPAALAVPFLLPLLLWRVKKFPYRYHSRRKRPGVFWALVLTVLLSWCWLALEVMSSLKLMPEWMETLRLFLRWLAEAWMMAGLQVFMIRMVMGWDEPVEPSDEKDLWLALERSLSHWQGILVLAALDLLWLLAWRTLAVPGHGLSPWLVVEASLVFAVVPVVIARFRMGWSPMVEVLAHVFGRTILPLLGFAITATVLLMLVHFSMRSLYALLPESGLWPGLIRILIALVLATVRSWLFLALVLALIRHGLKAAAPEEAGN